MKTENQGRIHLEFQPAYSPELNPDEQVWQTIKDDKLKNVCCKNKKELKEKVQIALQELKKDDKKVKSFFKHPEVAFY